MPEARLEKTRGTLPSGYQFGDAAKPPRDFQRAPLFGVSEMPISFAVLNPDFAVRLVVDSDEMETESTACR